MELTRKLWPFSGLSRFCRAKPRLPLQGSLFEASYIDLNRRTGYVISRSLVLYAILNRRKDGLTGLYFLSSPPPPLSLSNTAVCDPECMHGDCTSPGICSCNAGYEGHRCEDRKHILFIIAFLYTCMQLHYHYANSTHIIQYTIIHTVQ